MLKTNVTLHFSSKSRIIPKLQKINCNHVGKSSFQSSNPLFFNHKDLIYKPTAARLFRRTKTLPAKASTSKNFSELATSKAPKQNPKSPPDPTPSQNQKASGKIESSLKNFAKKRQIFSHDCLSIPASIRDTQILTILFPTLAHKIPRKSPELLTKLLFPTSPIKLKLGLQVGGRLVLLIATHLD